MNHDDGLTGYIAADHGATVLARCMKILSPGAAAANDCVSASEIAQSAVFRSMSVMGSNLASVTHPAQR